MSKSKEHRLGLDDLAWAKIQPKGDPRFCLGDIVLMRDGGIGMVIKFSSQSWGIVTYAIESIPGFNPPAYYAWHYELDIDKLLYPSAMRALLAEQS